MGSYAQDIVDVLQFTEKLLEFLVTLVPPPYRRQYRRMWDEQIKWKLQKVVQDVLARVPGNVDNVWKKLDDVGWDADSAGFKADMIASEAEAGKLENAVSFVNSSLGSLAKVFPLLEPAKEFKEFLEPWIKGRPEPEPAIQTLFGPGPIPAPKQ